MGPDPIGPVSSREEGPTERRHRGKSPYLKNKFKKRNTFTQTPEKAEAKGGGGSPEPHPWGLQKPEGRCVHTLILDFWPRGCCFKPSSLRLFYVLVWLIFI